MLYLKYDSKIYIFEYLNFVVEFTSAEEFMKFAKAIMGPIQNILSNETKTRREK